MKYTKILTITFIIGCILSGGITIILSSDGFFGNNLFDEFTGGKLTAEVETLFFFLILSFIWFIMLNLMCLPIYIVKAFLILKDSVNKKYMDTKQSIYTRDLPEYNSSIAGELLDLKTSFEEEYIAGVIELISKGYIREDKDMIFVDKTKSTEKLLKNEKYILQTCENLKSNLYFINNYNFYKKIKEDMIDLGLYKSNTILKGLINKLRFYLKKYNNSTVIMLYLLPFILCLVMIAFLKNFFVGLIFFVALYLMILFFVKKDKLTKKGELEKENMGKLKLFLEKETNFKDKNTIERKVWGRYSAFAVAFGLNTEMREEIVGKILKKQ